MNTFIVTVLTFKMFSKSLFCSLEQSTSKPFLDITVLYDSADAISEVSFHVVLKKDISNLFATSLLDFSTKISLKENKLSKSKVLEILKY